MHDTTKAARYSLGYVWAAIKLRIFVDSHGRRALFTDRSPIIVNRGEIAIGSHFRVRGRTQRVLIETGPAGRLRIGDEVFINQGSCIYAEHSVMIGDRVDIGDMVRIYDTNFHPTRPGDSTRVAPVIIEDDVWLASTAVVLPGVTIGRGSVIAAGAVVTRSVPPGSVVAGPSGEIVSTFDVPVGYRRRTVTVAAVGDE